MSFTAKDIHFSAGPVDILKGVDVEIEAGKLTVIIGPNGAGKSTFLKVLSDENEGYRGTVMLNGRDKDDWERHEKAKYRSILPQENTLAFAFKVIDVVLMGRYPHTLSYETQKDHDIAKEAMKMVGVVHLAERNYMSLSGGEKQRVQMARVLAQVWEPLDGQPRFIFLDEPISNLDLKFQVKLLKISKKMTQSNMGVLAILHDINLASQYADHIVVMKNGTVMAQGHPQDIMSEKLLSDTYEIPITLTRHPLLDCHLVSVSDIDD